MYVKIGNVKACHVKGAVIPNSAFHHQGVLAHGAYKSQARGQIAYKVFRAEKKLTFSDYFSILYNSLRVVTVY